MSPCGRCHHVVGHRVSEKRQEFALVSVKKPGHRNHQFHEPDRHAGEARLAAEGLECNLGNLAVGHCLRAPDVYLLVRCVNGINACFRQIGTVNRITSNRPRTDQVDTPPFRHFVKFRHIREVACRAYNSIIDAGQFQFVYKVLMRFDDVEMQKIRTVEDRNIDELFNAGPQRRRQQVFIPLVIDILKGQLVFLPRDTDGGEDNVNTVAHMGESFGPGDLTNDNLVRFKLEMLELFRFNNAFA